MEQIPNISPEQGRTEIGNKIQIDIALSQALSGEDAEEVLKRNAKSIGDYLDENPEILNEYEENKDSAIRKIKAILPKNNSEKTIH